MTSQDNSDEMTDKCTVEKKYQIIQASSKEQQNYEVRCVQVRKELKLLQCKVREHDIKLKRELQPK